MAIDGISTIEDQNELVTKVNALWAGGPLGIPEAPSDSKLYGRYNATWVETLSKTAIDAAVAAANVNASSRVAKTGDTMTGPLVLPVAPPSLATHAASKGYVDGLHAKQPVLLSTTPIPASASTVEITGLNNALYRTYDFIFEYMMPNANADANNLVFQIGDASGYLSGATAYVNSRLVDTIGTAVATFIGGELGSYCTMATSFGNNGAPGYGSMRLHLPPLSIGAGSYARLSGEIMHSGSTSNNYRQRFTGLIALSANDATRIQFFIWNGSAVQSWKNPTTPWSRILCYGVPG